MRSLKKQLTWCARTQWTMGIAVAVCGGIFYFVGYRPAINRLATLQQHVSAKQRDLDSGQNRASNFNALTREVMKLEGQVKNYDRQFPRQPELGQFIRDLTQISQRLSLQEWKYQPQAPRRGDSYFELPIQMHFEGDFVNVSRFLQQVEDIRHLQRLVRVKKVAIKSKDSKAGMVEVDMTMNIYYSEG